ncbi:hypothetical protein SAMN04244579_02426 [Azotobacter beijerinckii]|uniref:DUF3892 domain-containing protein n=1 Tax=Azotobacter beijerinckii TaxID=170623 RepID=A0A1H6USK3_9GAMM|nr:hypothetical protein [Azotobacter beijerinckii]SEI91270.1 hypothetical protein SAMN04244579_02426 [Azotobacter beijerinckii]
MAIYIVTRVRITNDEVKGFIWARADGGSNRLIEKEHEATIDEVIDAIDRGDTVEMTFETGYGRVSGGRLLKAALPGGGATVIEERGGPKRNISDLPRF